jgi:hypothetical protein
LPDLLTDFALVAAVFTVTALISCLWSTPRSILKGGLPWSEKRVSPILVGLAEFLDCLCSLGPQEPNEILVSAEAKALYAKF